MTTPSFIDFCNYIVSRKHDEETDLDNLVEFFVNFIEPFAEENDIEVPDELVEFVESLYGDDDI